MEINHKCNGCRYKSEHQEMGFRPFGVCTKETNLIEAEKAYKAEVCPYNELNKKYNVLKPCPFCGGKAKLIISAPSKLFSDEGETIHYKVRCDAEDSGCIGAAVNLWEYTKERAINAWNRRAENGKC